MSTHGRHGLARWLMGSVTDAVVRSAPTPVMVASCSAAEATQARGFQVLVVPLDGSRHAEAALPLAEEVAQRLSVRLAGCRWTQRPWRPNSTVCLPLAT